MAGGKLSPRQKLINMMYLVLMALLALNVSAEILKSFYLVESSMDKSGKNIDEKNKTIMMALQKAMDQDAAKTKPFFEKAQQAEKIAKDLVGYIDQLKKKLSDQTGGRVADKESPEFGQLVGRGDMDKHATVLINEKKGDELKKKINKARADLLALVDPKDVGMIRSSEDLKAEDDPKKKPQTWESELFEHSPLAAVMCLLTKIQNDAKNTASEVMAYQAASINAKDFKFDKLEAKVIAPSSYLMVGEQYEADIILSAFNSTQDNVIAVNGSPIKAESGVGKYKVSVGEGEQKYKGEIQVKDPSGEIKKYPFEGQYMGFKGTATIAADAMNVLYIGVDNPMSISVPGFPIENVVVTPANVALKPTGKGKYMATVANGMAGKMATINVSVKMKDGATKPMGKMDFRIKNLPKPRVMFGTIEGGDAPKGQVASTRFVNATLGQEFVFEGVRYSVSKFTMAYVPKRGDMTGFPPVQGNTLSPQMSTKLSQAKSGDMISVLVQEVVGPAGPVKLNSAIVINIK